MKQKWTFNTLKDELAKLLSKKRFLHVLGVYETALDLAKHYAIDPEQLAYAALLHDLTKELKRTDHLNLLKEIKTDPITLKNPNLWHAKTGYYLAIKQYNLAKDLVSPILWHTTGKKNMSIADKILYVADQIEPNRPWYKPELMELAKENIDNLMKTILKDKIIFTLNSYKMLHPDSLSLWNQLNAV